MEIKRFSKMQVEGLSAFCQCRGAEEYAVVWKVNSGGVELGG